MEAMQISLRAEGARFRLCVSDLAAARAALAV